MRGSKAVYLLTLTIFIGCGLMAQAQEQIDYDGFSDLTAEVAPIRQQRLVPLDSFNLYKGDAGTIILDTRSKAAFDAGHIKGAVHISFSDFTDQKLAEVIPSRDTRILIYCNNNFTDNTPPIMTKRSPLALNIPTFINLYGYGYSNLYELSGQYSIHDKAIDWEAPAAPATLEKN
ncbi:MAG: rhodanese-like domain-containing protein [Hyphomonas sp.]